jgi:hypothetical protein
MTHSQTQRFISYVVNYVNIVKNHIGENSIASQTITVSLNEIMTCALTVISRINKGDITDYATLVEACSPIGDAFFDQLCNDKDYEYYLNELATNQRDEHELPY